MNGGDRRCTDRRRSFARVLLSVEGIVGYLADVSEGGMRGLFTKPFAVETGRTYRIDIAFEELGIEPFSLDVTARWARSEEGAWLVGFQLLDTPADEEFLHYEVLRKYYTESESHRPGARPGAC